MPSLPPTSGSPDEHEALELRVVQATAENPDGLEAIWARLELAWALRFDERPRAAELAFEALSLAEARFEEEPAEERRRVLARACRVCGLMSLGQRNVRSPIDYGHRALEHYEALGDPHGEAEARDLLATVYEYLGDYGTASDYAYKALEQYRQVGDVKGEAWALSSVGGLLSATGDQEAARHRLDEALRIFTALDYPIGKGRILGRLGNLAMQQGRLDEARGFLEQGLSESRELGARFAIGSALSLLGQVEEQDGNLQKARELYEEASAALDDGLKRTMGLIIRANLGRVLYRLGQRDCAEKLLTEVQADAEHADIPAVLIQIHDALADLQEEQGKPAEALRHLRRTRQLREKMFNEETRASLRRFEVRLEVEAARKDAEIHRLRYVELERMQSELLEAEKLAVVGRLTAGITHELNTPLGVLRSNVATAHRAFDRMAEELAGPARPERIAALSRAVAGLRGTSEEAIDRISEMVDGLKHFASLDESELQPVALADSLESARALAVATAPDGASVELHLAEVPRLLGAAGPLNHAFLVLMLHAMDATATAACGRPVMVTLSRADEHLDVRFSDGGAVLDEEGRRRLFEVGFSDRMDRVRMRLSLSAVAATVKRHGGTVEALPGASGVGNDILVRLPLKRSG